MKFIVAATAFCVATVAITSVDAAKADRKDKQKAATSRILRKKLPTKGEAAAAAINEAEDKVLAEDEGYWERFLQNEVPSITDPPTPSPTGTCDTEVSSQFCVQLIHRNSYVIIIEPSRRKSFFFILIFFRFDSLSLLSHSM